MEDLAKKCPMFYIGYRQRKLLTLALLPRSVLETSTFNSLEVIQLMGGMN